MIKIYHIEKWVSKFSIKLAARWPVRGVSPNIEQVQQTLISTPLSRGENSYRLDKLKKKD